MPAHQQREIKLVMLGTCVQAKRRSLTPFERLRRVCANAVQTAVIIAHNRASASVVAKAPLAPPFSTVRILGHTGSESSALIVLASHESRRGIPGIFAGDQARNQEGDCPASHRLMGPPVRAQMELPGCHHTRPASQQA